MMLPLDSFSSFAAEHALFGPADKILLAVSGGKDSALMVRLFKGSGQAFGIAHCNFKLRGGESDLDEEFTRKLAGEMNVPLHVVRFDTQEYSRSRGISIQMAARELRYTWLEEIRSDNRYSAIAVAHHKNDTVETILLNLVRGTGISGMHGILPKRGCLIRPMLFLTREEIDGIIMEERIPYREDSSNSSLKYARNKLRIDVIPKLKELNPNLEETFAENSRRFAELEEYLKAQTDILREQLFEDQGSGEYIIEIEKLKGLTPRRTLLFELFRPFNFADNVLDDLSRSWDAEPGKRFESATHTILLDRQRLILRCCESDAAEDVLVNEKDTTIKWNDNIFLKKEIPAHRSQIKSDPSLAYIDAGLLVYPLKIRSWKEGDVFYPLGMKGKKKLSDFFINRKIPRSYKHLVPVLENGNGDIIWIAGYRADNRYKVSSDTKKVIIFELQNNGESRFH